MKVLICESPMVSSEGFVFCSDWLLVPYESLALKSELLDWESYLGFDLEVFSMVFGGLLLAFISGHVLGLIVRALNRT